VPRDLIGFVTGLVIAMVTAPVGVSGAVFLLPVQLTVLGVPNPQLTPTNLLYNVIAGPGALVRYVRERRLDVPLARQMVLGSAPGVVVGAVLRVYVAADPTTFRLIAAGVLLPTGAFILIRRRTAGSMVATRATEPGRLTALAFVVGIVGGLYGIGGGSLLAPILVGSGVAVRVAAPAALASTFVTSIVGVATFALLAVNAEGTISPDWSLGVACGLGGLIGGYAGARLQPRLPERFLQLLLGGLAIALAVAYAWQAAL
jgi:uncharacterized membrane protein YfcA